jgi:hypothetical protein
MKESIKDLINSHITNSEAVFYENSVALLEQGVKEYYQPPNNSKKQYFDSYYIYNDPDLVHDSSKIIKLFNYYFELARYFIFLDDTFEFSVIKNNVIVSQSIIEDPRLLQYKIEDIEFIDNYSMTTNDYYELKLIKKGDQRLQFEKFFLAMPYDFYKIYSIYIKDLITSCLLEDKVSRNLGIITKSTLLERLRCYNEFNNDFSIDNKKLINFLTSKQVISFQLLNLPYYFLYTQCLEFEISNTSLNEFTNKKINERINFFNKKGEVSSPSL